MPLLLNNKVIGDVNIILMWHFETIKEIVIYNYWKHRKMLLNGAAINQCP